MILPQHKRMVLWGFTGSLDSFRHIHRHFAHALHRLEKRWLWLPDDPPSRDFLEAGDLVFAVDVEAHHLGSPLAGVDYLLHNIGVDHPVWDGVGRFVRLQVYTDDAEQYGEAWGPVRRFDRESRTLFQPWGTDLLADEFHPPVFNPRSREAVFVGSVWDDGGLGNADAFRELQSAVRAHRLTLRHAYHVSDDENVTLVRGARIAPAIAGRWQVEHNYLPCRVFKNVSYGALAITNVPTFRELLGWMPHGSIFQIVDAALSLGELDYLSLVREQQEVVARSYTYRESLEAIGRAFEEAW